MLFPFVKGQAVQFGRALLCGFAYDAAGTLKLYVHIHSFDYDSRWKPSLSVSPFLLMNWSWMGIFTFTMPLVTFLLRLQIFIWLMCMHVTVEQYWMLGLEDILNAPPAILSVPTCLRTTMPQMSSWATTLAHLLISRASTLPSTFNSTSCLCLTGSWTSSLLYVTSIQHYPSTAMLPPAAKAPTTAVVWSLLEPCFLSPRVPTPTTFQYENMPVLWYCSGFRFMMSATASTCFHHFKSPPPLPWV